MQHPFDPAAVRWSAPPSRRAGRHLLPRNYPALGHSVEPIEIAEAIGFIGTQLSRAAQPRPSTP